MDAFSVKLKQSISHKQGVKVLTKRLCHPLPGLAFALTAVPGTDRWYDEPENLKRNNQLKDCQVNGIQSNVICTRDAFQNRFSGSCSDLRFWPPFMAIQYDPKCTLTAKLGSCVINTCAAIHPGYYRPPKQKTRSCPCCLKNIGLYLANWINSSSLGFTSSDKHAPHLEATETTDVQKSWERIK